MLITFKFLTGTKFQVDAFPYESLATALGRLFDKNQGLMTGLSFSHLLIDGKKVELFNTLYNLNISENTLIVILSDLDIMSKFDTKEELNNIRKNPRNLHIRQLNKGIYFGEIYNSNILHGRGAIFYDDGTMFMGNFVENKLNGDGFRWFKNGDIYCGDYKDGKQHGKGIFKWKDGDVYEGCWSNDKRNGKGIYRYNNGTVYDGNWKDNLRDGRGIYKYANGNVYDGEFKDDVRHGKGTMNYNNGDFVNGVWEEDELVEQIYFKQS